jgi:acetaldehyde dehydrogenase (acetylating)
MIKKIKVGILGTGNIGTDLLIKVMRSEFLECVMFSGRNFSSPGMSKASSLGVKVSDEGIGAFNKEERICDIVFDATSAAAHLENAKLFKRLGIFVIDMTPAKVGVMCVPEIDVEDIITEMNVNMITCGGQASIPIAYAISQAVGEIDYIETVSTISSKSAGPATRDNIDEYIDATEKGLQKYTGAKSAKAMININPASPPINMQTTVMVKIVKPDMTKVLEKVNNTVKNISEYVPGYSLVFSPVYDELTERLIVTVKVQGVGDYLPKYAGNLDIINCAAIRVAEYFCQKHGG